MLVNQLEIQHFFNRCGTTQDVVLDIQKAFDGVSQVGVLYNVRFYVILGHVFSFLLLLFGNKQIQVVLDKHLGKSITLMLAFLHSCL